MKSKEFEIDMIHGPLLGKILLFSVPLIFSGLLQLLFNAADVVVVGRFAGAVSLAAVGCAGPVVNLLISTFQGLSMGTNVLTARYFAGRENERLRKIVQTSVVVALAGGVLLTLLGLFGAEPLLRLTGAPDDVRPMAVLYMRIYFLGMPVSMLYNFGSAVLMGTGDTRRPLLFLTIAGALNVVMNLLFVIVFHLGVAGVALATILSQAFSAVLVLRCLMRAEGPYRLELAGLSFDPASFRSILRIGLPAGLEGVVFGFSNAMIQSSINSFGATFIAGNAAALSLEGFVYTAMNAMYQACLSFTSANFGVHDFGRMKTIVWQCAVVAALIGLVMGGGFTLAAPKLMSLYTSDAEAIVIGAERMHYTTLFHALCGVMNVLCGAVRGMGIGLVPTVISLTGACGLRLIWILTLFAAFHTPAMLYAVYPAAWVVTLAGHLAALIWYRRRLAGFASRQRSGP